jgi:galactosamine-6-phosphate isomerase
MGAETNQPPAHTMRIIEAKNYQALSRRAADLIATELHRKPDLLLCASAGSTPTGAYQCLAALHSRRPGLFRRLRVLQIDEWSGLPRGSPASCETDLGGGLLAPLGIGPDRYVGFRSELPNPATECERIARWLQANGPIDLCLLGLGRNGHIAMNEPAAGLSPHPHVARLAKSSREHSMLKALPRKPRYGLTLGLGDILKSRKILLLVSGRHKRASLKRLLQPNITTRFPASFLWLHPDATVLHDRDAGA